MMMTMRRQHEQNSLVRLPEAETKATPCVALVGTGNFARNVAARLSQMGISLCFCVDEFRTEPFLEVPVYAATQLTPELRERVARFIVVISQTEHAESAVARLQAQQVSAERVLVLDDDPVIQIMASLFERHGDAFVQALLDPHFPDLIAIETHFSAAHWQTVWRQLRGDSPVIGAGFYGRGGGFRQHLAPVVEALAAHYQVVTLADEDLPNEVAGTAARQLRISAAAACRQPEFDLMLSAHVFPCSPRTTPRVTFSHVIYDFNLTQDYHAERIAYSDTHYLFAASRSSVEGYLRLIHDKQLANRLCVIPGGYPHLDANIACSQRYAGPQDAIVYAPTLALADYPHVDLASSIEQGPALLQALLEAFPAYQVIFRPHPSDLSLLKAQRQDARSRAFLDMLALCEAHPRCLLDQHPTAYMMTYNRAAALVSDTSSTAMTFAFSTGRPAFFLSPQEARLRQLLGGQMAFLSDRERVGGIATTLPDLIDLMAGYLQDIQKHRQLSESITGFRDQVIFHVGHSAQYFCDQVDRILAGEKHADWHYINAG